MGCSKAPVSESVLADIILYPSFSRKPDLSADVERRLGILFPFNQASHN